MIRLLLFMNITGIIYYLLYTIFLPFGKISLPTRFRIFTCRLNMVLFIFPFPLFLPYLRKYFNNFSLKIPFDPALQNGSHITIHLANDVCVMLPKPNLLQILFLIVWLITSIRLFIKYTRDQHKLNRFHSSFELFMEKKMVNHSINVTDLVHTVMNELHIKRQIHIYTLENLFMPHVSGIFRLKLFLPANWDVSEQVYYMAIKHELAHIRHKDLPFQFLSFIACTIHWFNPLVHLLASRINNYEELSADACACSGFSKKDRIDYATAILDLMEIIPNFSNTSVKGLGFKINDKLLIDERLMQIVKDNKERNNIGKLAFSTLISIFILTISIIPAMSYNLPPTITNKDTHSNTIDLFEIDTLPPENESSSLLFTIQPMQDELYSLLNNLDFSNEDTYCIDESGIVSSTFKPYFTDCEHNFVSVHFSSHEKTTSGSCTIKVFNAERCTKCNYLVVKDLFATTEFDKCSH